MKNEDWKIGFWNTYLQLVWASGPWPWRSPAIWRRPHEHHSWILPRLWNTEWPNFPVLWSTWKLLRSEAPTGTEHTRDTEDVVNLSEKHAITHIITHYNLSYIFQWQTQPFYCSRQEVQSTALEVEKLNYRAKICVLYFSVGNVLLPGDPGYTVKFMTFGGHWPTFATAQRTAMDLSVRRERAFL